MRGATWWIDRWRQSSAYMDMTLAEQGAYRNLLDDLWLREGPIPDDERILGKACGDRSEWPVVREAVLSKFTLGEGGWSHTTQEEVFGQAQTYRESQAEKGRKGAEARWGKSRKKNGPANGPANGPVVAQGIATGLRSQVSENSTQESEKDNDPVRSASPKRTSGRAQYTSSFEQFWAAFPRRVGKGRAADAWKRLKCHEILEKILEHVEAMKKSEDWTRDGGQFIPHPTTWLNGRRWDDPVPDNGSPIVPETVVDLEAARARVEARRPK